MSRSLFDTLESRCLLSGTGLEQGISRDPDAAPTYEISVPVRQSNQVELDSEGTSPSKTNPKEAMFSSAKISNQAELDSEGTSPSKTNPKEATFASAKIPNQTALH